MLVKEPFKLSAIAAVTRLSAKTPPGVAPQTQLAAALHPRLKRHGSQQAGWKQLGLRHEFPNFGGGEPFLVR